MICPKCNYPNPQGVAYCQLCYETFLHSAAKSYLHIVRQQRREAEKPKRSIDLGIGRFFAALQEAVAGVDWADFRRRYRRPLLYGAAAAAGFSLLGVALSPSFRLGAYGTRLPYAFDMRKPVRYLVGFRYAGRMWSERSDGLLDTPMEEFQISEIGNVSVRRDRTGKRERQQVTVRADEWIQIAQNKEGPVSRAIPMGHPSLAAGSVSLDRRGTVHERLYKPSPRLAKSIDFLLPAFPKGSLRRGQSWTEPARWVETMGDWKIFWSGEMQWKLLDQAPCGKDSCVRLGYRGRIVPKLWAGPAWAKGALGSLAFKGTAEGEAFFNLNAGRLLSNTLLIQGRYRVPLRDLSLIPWDLRVGRQVEGDGVINIDFTNRLDVRQN